MNLFDRLTEPDEPRILTVSELTGQIRRRLEGEFSNLTVEGELSNFVRHSSGHWYFTLKDDKAQIRAACFRNANQKIRFRPADGLKVYARGKISVYEPRGDFQLIVDRLEPVGIGELQLAFEQLKTRLEQEGLFAPARKRPIPLLPKAVGIVTSPTGAAIRDILRVLGRRNNRVNVVLYPAAVEGDPAPAEIAAGIKYFNEHRVEIPVEVLIVGRGGGSAESLWAFNDERVARAIFHSELPVISAVGHEVDFTIADFVADLRAPTPSAAAEIVSARHDELVTRIERLSAGLERTMRYQLLAARSQVQELTRSDAFADVRARVRNHQQQTDELALRAEQALTARFEKNMRRFEQAVGKLDALSPLRVLQRGYAVAFDAKGETVRTVTAVTAGAALRVRLVDGELHCTVTEVTKKSG
ncbi:MAG: exodeoxyribonuclease VII large subunit [Blastocatellia bacterium]|nr:exodeoxyribonuclease VII large subunit [Blastocatellia bacterium]